jgi:hypothetical protein
MRRNLVVLAMASSVALGLAACASVSKYPDVSTAPPGPKLPIDGLWRHTQWVASGRVFAQDWTYRIETGRMSVQAPPEYLPMGSLIAKEIRQTAPARYTAQVAHPGAFGGAPDYHSAGIEIRQGPRLVVRYFGGRVEWILEKVALDDEAWFAAQLAADRILARSEAPPPAPVAAAPPPRPAPVVALAPGALEARVEKLGGASWALVVGINAYRHADRLNYAVADARAVAAALPGLGFQHVRVLLDEDATRANIERAIYVDFKEKMGRDDRLFVFFAGHGITVDLPRGGEEGYLIPVDGDPRRPEVTAIAMDEIRKMGRRVSARHIFFAIDSCFSGFALTRDIRPEAVSAGRIAAALEEPVVQVLTAGRKGQKAVEEGGHGLFTRRLLDGLRGLADREGRGFVTATELAAWLGPRVVRDSGGRQDPQYSALDGEGDFVFRVPRR